MGDARKQRGDGTETVGSRGRAREEPGRDIPTVGEPRQGEAGQKQRGALAETEGSPGRNRGEPRQTQRGAKT